MGRSLVQSLVWSLSFPRSFDHNTKHVPSVVSSARPTLPADYQSSITDTTDPNPAIPVTTKAAKKPTKKKYKPVALKVKPIIGELPDKFRIIRNIVGEPLKDMPTLDPNSTLFKPTGRYNQEWKDLFSKNHEGFLLDEERKFLHNFMMQHQDTLIRLPTAERWSRQVAM